MAKAKVIIKKEYDVTYRTHCGVDYCDDDCKYCEEYGCIIFPVMAVTCCDRAWFVRHEDCIKGECRK